MATKAAEAKIVTRPTAETIMARFVEMAGAIPFADDSMAGLDMIEQILTAGSVLETNEIWGTDDEEKVKDQMIGNVITIETIERRESDFAEGLPWYLDCDVINHSRGDIPLRLTISAGSAVAQLVKAYMGSELPIKCIPQAEKTRKGFTAIHLQVLAVNVPVQQGL